MQVSGWHLAARAVSVQNVTAKKVSKTRKHILEEQRPRLCSNSHAAQPNCSRKLASPGKIKTEQRPGHGSEKTEQCWPGHVSLPGPQHPPRWDGDIGHLLPRVIVRSDEG